MRGRGKSPSLFVITYFGIPVATRKIEASVQSPFPLGGLKLLSDVPSATAILDRFLQTAEIIEITGKSYQLKDSAGKKSD